MNIFLVYLVINSPQDTRYNYGLGYISSVLKRKGYGIDYITLKNKEDIAALYEKVKSKRPGMIGFSATTSQFYYLKDIAKKLKEISDALIICGGIHPTLKPDCALEIPALDAIVRGEGEFPMLELADALENKSEFHKIRNFWFKEKVSIIKNEIRPLIKNLDDLPYPDKDSLDYQRVIDEGGGLNRFIFSRGCTFNCTYCSNKALSDLYKDSGPYFRLQSPGRAIKEIELDAGKYKFKEICFDDDTISLNKKWFYEFFDLYRKQFKYGFLCNVRPGNIDPDMIKLLKEAGLKRAVVGIEHGNEGFRKRVLQRNMTNKQIIDTFKLLNQYDIKYTGQIMLGFPYENKNLFLDTVKLCRKLSIETSNNVSVFYPYPGTKLGDLCAEKNWLPDKKFYRERSDTLISYPGFSKNQIRLCARTFSIFMRYKSIPLKTPLRLVRLFHKFMRAV